MSDDETCDICRLPSRDHTKYGGCLAAASKENTTLRAENERLKAIENAAFDFFCAVDVDPDKSPTFRALRDALSVIDSAVFDAGGIEDG